MKYKDFFIVHIVFYLISVCGLDAQLIDKVYLFPDSHFVHMFTADAHAHKMSIENIELSRNNRVAMGGTFPLLTFNLMGTPVQASFGASVHFELQPSGQIHIVSSEYYVDYFILDLLLKQNQNSSSTLAFRFAGGHTSHHLSDSWTDEDVVPNAIHYARDYLRLCLIYSKVEKLQLYFGLDYGYIFTIDHRTPKPWTIQLGGETVLFNLFETVTAYIASDYKLKQEAGFATTGSFHVGIKMPMQSYRTIRVAYQFCHGLDERGQFFPQHRKFHSLGVYIEI